MTKETKLTKYQEIVMGMLYDVAANDGGWIILGNRYRSTVSALIRRGYVEKRQEGSNCPKYKISQAGIDYWKSREE